MVISVNRLSGKTFRWSRILTFSRVTLLIVRRNIRLLLLIVTMRIGGGVTLLCFAVILSPTLKRRAHLVYRPIRISLMMRVRSLLFVRT